VVVQADEAGFRRELADARTFGFVHEVEALGPRAWRGAGRWTMRW
jgi:UDP-3-O-acyl-N-acetylglucosamine deacetylase